MKRAGRAAAAGAVLIAAFGIEVASAELDFGPCPAAGAECAELSVPLDAAEPAGPRVPIAVTRVRGVVRSASPLLVLTGGPGQAGLGSLPGGVEAMRALSRNAGGPDVLALDQRGTGVSALRCAAADGTATAGPAPGSPVGAASACAAELGTDRVHYTTNDTIRDLERMRVELGLERWAVLGISYGSFVGSTYARLHPERLERLVLDSPVPLEGESATGTETFAAARRVVTDLCADGACRGITRDVRGDVRKLADRLRTRAVRGVAVDGLGRPTRVPFGGPSAPGALFKALVVGDQLPAARAAFPAATTAALAGDASLLNRIVGAGGQVLPNPREQSDALFLATICQESEVPWVAEQSAPARRDALGAALQAQEASVYEPFTADDAAGADIWSVCVGWPEVETFRAPPGGIPDVVPSLVLVGTTDIRTPLEVARAIEADSPAAQVLPVVGSGHSVLTEERACVDRALRAFFGGEAVGSDACGVAPAGGLAPVRVPPRGLAGVPRVAGLPPVVGRTVSAALLTLEDVEMALDLGEFGETTARGTGLRGGTVTGRTQGAAAILRLERDVYVPGVAVSGTLRNGAGRLRIDGARASGALRLRPDGRISGRIGGRAISLVPTRLTQTLAALPGVPPS